MTLPSDASDVHRWGCGCLTYLKPDPRFGDGKMAFVLDACGPGKGKCPVAVAVAGVSKEKRLPVRLVPRSTL